MPLRPPSRRLVSRGIVTATALSMSLLAATSRAHLAGSSGYSGKSGVSCSLCHGGGATPPAVALDGPATLQAGETSLFTLIVTTDAPRVGVDVGASDGVTLTASSGTRAKDYEITHAPAIGPTSGAARFTFSVTAPDQPGRITLFAAGNATNGDGTTKGDATSTTTLSIDVVAGDAGAMHDASASLPPASSNGTTTTPTNGAGAGSDVTVQDAAIASPRPSRFVARRDPSDDDPGCSAASVRARSDARGSVAVGLLLALAGWIRRRGT